MFHSKTNKVLLVKQKLDKKFSEGIWVENNYEIDRHLHKVCILNGFIIESAFLHEKQVVETCRKISNLQRNFTSKAIYEIKRQLCY